MINIILDKTLILLLISTSVFSITMVQNTTSENGIIHHVSGIVLDSSTRQPIPNVTVFIDGTTRGTITNNQGHFVLENISIPSVMVVSHVSYSPYVKNIKSDIPDDLTIVLRKKTFDLSEIRVVDKSLRKKNLAIFNQMFIGSDHWGENAQIINDSVLIFNHEYEYKKIILNDFTRKEIKSGLENNIYEWGNDSSFVIIKELSVFKAEAKTPLIIDMPLLGYKLRVDLVNFTIDYSIPGQLCSFLAYYYFQPYDSVGKSKLKRIEKNRQLAYYNSTQHFLRSLFNKKFAQNGYELIEEEKDTVTNKIIQKSVSIDGGLKYIENNQMQITRLKDRHLFVIYFYKGNGNPIDLTQQKRTRNYKTSEVYFLSDTCTVSSTGTIPDYKIIFSGEISAKKVGAILPEDYTVKNEIELSEN